MLDDIDIEEIENILFGDEMPILECGCMVEPDGVCPCGNKSPLLELGLI